MSHFCLRKLAASWRSNGERIWEIT